MDFLPVIDNNLIQQKVNEAAEKGMMDTVKEYFNGFNSPYKKAIEEQLKSQGFDSFSIEIPNIIAILNDGISKQIDRIANEAVAKTFLPLVQRTLTKIEGEVKFSEILEEAIKSTNYNWDEEIEKKHFRVEELITMESGVPEEHFLHFNIVTPIGTYRMFLCNDDFHNKNKSKNLYRLCNLPEIKNDGYRQHLTMKLSTENGATLEMPFVPNILKDNFMAYCARLVISKAKIVFDETAFEYGLFPERENCSCH